MPPHVSTLSAKKHSHNQINHVNIVMFNHVNTVMNYMHNTIYACTSSLKILLYQYMQHLERPHHTVYIF